MPVKSRRAKDTHTWTPPSLLNESFDIDDGDFIQDPDQHRDELPQPYRMLNKLLDRVLDNVWEHVSERESDRIADASRFRPPQYECAVFVEDESNAVSQTECLSVTPDGEFVILGLQNGLAAVRASTHQLIDIFTDDGLHAVCIQTCILAEDKYLLTTIDDMGAVRIYALAGDQIYHVTSIAESDGSKVIASTAALATSGDFLSLFMEKPSTQEGWVEVYKLPKEAWIKDLDALVNKASHRDVSQSSTQQATKSPTPPTDAPLETSQTSDAGEAVTDQSAADVQISGVDDSASRERKTQSPSAPRSSHAFSSSTLLIKVLPPAPVTGAIYSSVQQASKALDCNGDVIGTRANHLLSAAHLERRTSVFRQNHSDLMAYLPEEESKNTSSPTMHYLRPGRIFPQGLDKTDQPSSVAIWWSEDTQLMVYSLHKQSKDTERKPDFVAPLSSRIVASGLSADGSQLALAMRNNNLIVWDMYLGNPKGVIRLDDEGHVTRVSFLDPSVCPQNVVDYPPYPTATSYYIMVAMDNGQVYLVNSSHMGEPPVTLDLNIVKPDELPSVCDSIDGIPDLLLTCRQNGCVYLHDAHRGNQICEVVLPPGYQLMSPWQPLIAVAAKGGMMYLKGQPKSSSPPVSREDTEMDPPETEEVPPSKLFVFQLRSFPSLDKYRARERPNVPFVVHSVVNSRVNALFKDRISRQGNRVARTQARWDQLKNEVEMLNRLREERQQKAQRDSSYPCPSP